MTERMVDESGQSARSTSEECLKALKWFNEKGVPELTRQIVAGELDKDQFQALIAHQDPFKVPGWIRKRIKKLDNYLMAFFGKAYDLTLFQKTLQKYGKKQVEHWEEMGLMVGYLPKEKMSQDAKFWEGKVRPGNFLYEQSRAGNILRLNPGGELIKDKHAGELEEIVILFDTRCKPSYTDGSQMWENDEKYLGTVIANLRKEGKIKSYDWCPQSSRFGITVEPNGEWYKHVRPALAGLLGPRVDINSVRFETATESNVLSQLYSDLFRGEDGETNTWYWLEQFFEGTHLRLNGGNSDYGGLASIDWDDSNEPWNCISFRPLAVLAPRG